MAAHLDHLPLLTDLDIKNERVLIRFDGDVPVENGKIADANRLTSLLPTLEHCLTAGAHVVLTAHRGRPDGKPDKSLSNTILAEYLSYTLKQDVVFVPDIYGKIPDDPIIMLENLRFYKGEECNDTNFALRLAQFGTIYCNDAFAVSHRAHASVVAVAKLLPHAAGFQMHKEITQLTQLRDDADAPYIAILGGAKASDKSPIIGDLIERVDGLIIGGLITITYLAAMGCPIGAHEVEDKQVVMARRAIRSMQEEGIELLMPIDYLNQEGKTKPINELKGKELMLDIGAASQQKFAKTIEKANTLFWNGAMGKFEDSMFSQGTVAIGRAIAASAADTRIGSGGDTVSAIHQHHLANAFTFISTGGGATLEFIAGRELPGITALMSSKVMTPP